MDNKKQLIAGRVAKVITGSAIGRILRVLEQPKRNLRR